MNPFCRDWGQPQKQDGCVQRLHGLQRLADPFVANAITTIPLLAGEAKFTLSTIDKDNVSIDLGDASKWMSKILRELSQVQIQADIYGGHAQLLLDAPGNYWDSFANDRSSPEFSQIKPYANIRGLVSEGDFFVDPTKGESTAIHSSRVLSIPSRAWVIAGQDVMNLHAIGNIATLQRNAGYGYTWSASSVLDSFWSWWEPFRESHHELRELIRRKDFLLLTEEGLKRESENSGDPIEYVKSILKVSRQAVRDEGILLSDDNRKAEFVARTLTGVTDIHEAIRIAAIGASGLTEATLFNFTLTGGGLASVDLRDRLSIQSAILKVLTRWEQQLEPLLAAVGLVLEWDPPLYLTPMEVAGLYSTYAAADSQYVAMGSITSKEARSRLEGGWTQGLTLDSEATETTQNPQVPLQTVLKEQPIDG